MGPFTRSSWCIAFALCVCFASVSSQELTAALWAVPTETSVNSPVTLQCYAYESLYYTAAVIANVTWKQEDVVIGVSEDNKINVTSDTPGEVNFTCTVVDENGDSASSSGLVEFFDNPVEDWLAEIAVAMSADPIEPIVYTLVKLECHAYELGNFTEAPIANVTWTQDDIFIGVTQDNKINVTSDTPGEVNFTCTVIDDYGRSATANGTVEFFEDVVEDWLAEIAVAMSADPMEAIVDTIVMLECHAYELGNFTEAPIDNVTWTQDDIFIAVTQDNKINVTSDTPGEVNFTCTVIDDYGRNATANGTVEFFEDVIEDWLAEIAVAMSADPMEAIVDTIVILECYAYELGNFTEAPIANVTWTQDDIFIGVTQDNKINVTSDTPGEVNFTCTVIDDYGRNATANGTIEFFEDVIEDWLVEIAVAMSADPMEAIVDTIVILECHAYELGNFTEAPIANVTWTQNDVFIGVTQDNKINVTSDTPGEVNFTCTVIDDYGRNATANGTIEFFEDVVEDWLAEIAVAMSADPMEAIVDTIVILECHAYELGNFTEAPIANVTWTQDDVFIGVTQDNKINVTSDTPGEVNFTCTVIDDYGRNATGNATVEFFEDVIEDWLVEIAVAMSADPMEAIVDTIVILECHAYELGNFTEAPIANVTWTQNDVFIGVTQDNKINVTSDTPGEVNFTCTVIDDYGRNATANGTIEFFEDVVEDWLAEIAVAMSADPMEAIVDTIVMLECHAYELGNFTEAPIDNVTWTQDDIFIAVTQDNKINVTSDTPGEVNFTCTVIDDYGRNATANGTVEFFEDVIEDWLAEIAVAMSADPMEAIVDTIVILECYAYELGNFTEAPIANVTWTQDDIFIGVTQDNKINVTSDTPGEVNFTCTVIDDYGRNATANGTIEFFEDVIEDWLVEIAVAMSADPMEAIVDTIVILECHAYELGNFTEAPIANVTWTQNDVFIGVTQDNKINVTSDTPGEVNFTCTVIDDYGRNATANGTIEFFEDVVEDWLAEIAVAMSADPMEAIVDTIVILECHAYELGNFTEAPIANVTWTQDDVFIGVTQDNKINVTSDTPGEVNFTCTVIDDYGRNATANGTIEFFEDVIEDWLVEIAVAMSADPMEAIVDTIVILECHAYELGNFTEAPIANVTWTQNDVFIGVTQDNKINVTSDTPGEVNFTCTVIDDYGRNATANGTIEFFEDVVEVWLAEIALAMSADPMEAIVDTIVILECHAYELGNFTEAPIANVTWTKDDIFIAVTQDNKINVTSDTPGEMNFTCTVIDDYGRIVTANGTVEFFEDVIEDWLAEIAVSMSADPMEAIVDTIVILECHAYELGNFTEAPIANVTWTQDDIFIAVTQDNKINVTSDTPGEVNFTCTVIDDYGRNATANGTVEFLEDVIEDLDGLVATLSAQPMEAAVDAFVTLECNAYQFANNTEAPIANVTWTQGGTFLSVTQDNKINVTSDTPGEVNFTCTAIDDYGRNATANGTVEFFEDVIEDLDGLVAALSAQPMGAAVDAFVTLECNAYQFANYTEAPIANVTWTQGGTFLSVTQDNKINVTSDTPGEVNFTCTVIDDYGRNATANRTIEFFEEQQSDLYWSWSAEPWPATVEDIVTLTCYVYAGDDLTEPPIANVTWKQGDVLLGVTQNNTINVTSDTPGVVRYTCAVIDEYGRTVTGNLTVEFFEDLDALGAELIAERTGAAVDAFVTLECNAYKIATYTETPIANVTWTQGGTFLSVTQDNKINVTSDTPGMVNFTCTVIDDYGRNATANVTVDFYEETVLEDLDEIVVALSAQPMEAAVDAFVTLECNVDQGDHDAEALIANVTWTQDGTFLSVTQDNKINVTSDTAGEVNFTCTVIDDYGWNATANVTVDFYEEIDVAEQLSVTLTISASDASEVPANTTVTLECLAYVVGNNATVPIANTTWTRDGSVIDGAHYSEINVTSGIAADVSFRCYVTDAYGRNGTEDITIEFKNAYQPVQAHISANGHYVTVDTTVELQCWPYLGQAPFSISWKKDGIKQANETDNYLYVTSSIEEFVEVECTVLDGANGNDTRSFTVEFYMNSSNSIYPEVCGTGHGYSWVQAGCVECDPTHEYNDGGLETCSYCSRTTGRSDACDPSDPAKTTQIGTKDICITSAIWSVTCNASSVTLAKINKGLSKDARIFYLSAFPDSSGLCANDACENIVVTAARKSQLCQTLSCNASQECIGYNYKSTVKACLYAVDEFVNTGVGSIYRRAEELFLESVRNIGQFPSSSSRSTTFMESLMLSNPPDRVDTTSVPDDENRELLAHVHTSLDWSSSYQSSGSSDYIALNAIIQDQLPAMYGSSSDLLFVTMSNVAQYTESQSNFVMFSLSLVFRKAIDDSLIEATSEIGIRSHSVSNGKFGNTSWHFQSELQIFRNQSDMQNGRSGVVWCPYLETLSQSLSLSYCGGDTDCSNTDLWFECVQDDTLKQQRDLYPYGSSAGDSVLEYSTSSGWSWYYDHISETINFTAGAPFGTRKMKYAHVLPNGVITFGSPHRVWWPSLTWAQYYREKYILAPFWHGTNYYYNEGKVYYQLYEKPGVNGGSGISSSSVDTWSAVLDRAKAEVQETLGVVGFDPTAALVATWYKVEPYNWWSWMCEYYERYQYSYWWSTYYHSYYEEYCLSPPIETNTFQCVYVTDGQLSYAITTYKTGEMNWRYERYRPIDVGFSSPAETMDFDFRYTDLTTKLTTNTFNTGRYGTWIEKVGEFENTDAKCVKFFIQNLYMMWFNSTHQALLDTLYTCPCNMERLGFQWTFYSWSEAPWKGPRTSRYCYYLGRKSMDPRIMDNPHNKLCCYYYTYPTFWSWGAFREARRNSLYIHYSDPYAGHILKHDPYRPWFWRSGATARLSRQEDFDPKNWCTRDSSVPSVFGLLFQLVRPDMGCSNDVEWFLGRAMGDPHITTLDSKSYTFNGKGEYILLQADSIDFSLQARTDQATNSEGNLTLATVFVAFAAKEGNTSKFQVELNDDKTGMVITANGNDISAAFYTESNYTFESNTLTVEREERNSSTVVTAAFPSNIALEIYVGIRNLEFTVTVPTSLKGDTAGLMGNYNDDNSDDFKLPDGTTLTTDQTNTERKVFENFGREWEVTSSTSIFKYATGETALTYQFPDFEPLFREEANQTLLQQAEDTCGAQEDACIFDLLATGDQTFAEATKSSAQENANIQQSLNNNLPVLSLTTTLNSQNRWQVLHGQEGSLLFSATDADGDIITYELAEAVSGVSVGNSSGEITYTPDYTTPVVFGVRASDGKGKSDPLYVDIVVCTACNSHGSCDWSNTRETEYENGRFLIAACSCWPAYTGDDCENDVDGCEDEPCGEGLNCTDIAAADQGNQTTGYLCGDCPDGYGRQGASCVDTNECIENGTSPVCPENSNCENSIGSYSCSCSTGYRTDPADAEKCKDIDECAEQNHDCEQVCDNTPGSFNCTCYGGGTLNPDGRSCTSTAICSSSCDHFCQRNDDGTTQCNCRRGFELDADGVTCNDLDECSGKTPCAHGCTNTDGGFTCYCFAGFQLEADNSSCTECETSYWGENCANQCQCNGRGTCERARGCVCNTGWTGTRCVTDVNECAVDGACPAGQVCTNTKGSYSCSCPEGNYMNNGVCEDVDECEDVLLHTCDLTTQDCSNNAGSYSCVCKSGYARNVNNECADIDECSIQSHGCEQICENTDGSYNCDCYLGYRLDTDRRNCVLRSDPCEGIDNLNLNCSQICTVDLDTNTAHCVCNAGYGLVGTETCEDIDECQYDHLNLCSYKLGCINTVGGFQCSCPSGSILDNDERSCVACGTGTWGVNCANSCDCDFEGASTCDVEIGCVCNTGFTGTHCDEDVDECTSGALTCEEGERCVNTRGSAECQCYDGYRRVLGVCTDIDECAIVSNNDCEQVCTNYAGGYKCSCHPGYQKSGNQCTDIDECALNADDCGEGCENSEGSYRCTCPEGLKLFVDGVSCVVEDACVVRTDCTDMCAIMNDTETCFCPRGKALDVDGFTCIDLDMCDGAPCESHCSETVDGTSFNCSCDAGKQLAGNGFNCSDCIEGTYGVECSQECVCSDFGTASCDKVNGACSCNTGWDGADCSHDVDECTDNTHNCTSKPFSTCENTPGSFVCKCDDGYYTENGQCSACLQFTYGDECGSSCNCNRQSSSGCDAISGVCTCNSGWTGESCSVDVDECAVSNNTCAQANRTNWVCENTAGSYLCQCEEGYQDTNNECIDLDECAAEFTNLCNQNCSNTIGNYTCSCNSGYLLASDRRACEDEDECTSGQHACEDECVNTVPYYTCSCRTGRELDSDNKSCYDALSSASTVTLVDMDATGLNLREHLGTDYINTEALVLPELLAHFQQKASVTKITITDLRAGSIIVDFTSVINTETTTDPESKLADALVALATNGITINGTFTNAQIIIGGLTVTSSTDKCEIMAVLNACDEGETCQISESGSAYCSSSDGDDTDIALIVGLSVGIPLAVLAIAGFVAAMWYKKKYKGQKRVNSRMDNYSDEPEMLQPSSSSDDPFSIFRANQMKNQLIDNPKWTTSHK